MDIIKIIFDHPIPLIFTGYLLFLLLILWVDPEDKFRKKQ